MSAGFIAFPLGRRRMKNPREAGQEPHAGHASLLATRVHDSRRRARFKAPSQRSKKPATNLWLACHGLCYLAATPGILAGLRYWAKPNWNWRGMGALYRRRDGCSCAGPSPLLGRQAVGIKTPG